MENKMENKVKFEEAMSLLEAAVARLESGSLGLDDAIAEYERAVGLVKICNERLLDAEQKVRLLTEGADGSVSDRPFGGLNED